MPFPTPSTSYMDRFEKTRVVVMSTVGYHFTVRTHVQACHNTSLVSSRILFLCYTCCYDSTQYVFIYDNNMEQHPQHDRHTRKVQRSRSPQRRATHLIRSFPTADLSGQVAQHISVLQQPSIGIRATAKHKDRGIGCTANPRTSLAASLSCPSPAYPPLQRRRSSLLTTCQRMPLHRPQQRD
jgi:hypothetical protein